LKNLSAKFCALIKWPSVSSTCTNEMFSFPTSVLQLDILFQTIDHNPFASFIEILTAAIGVLNFFHLSQLVCCFYIRFAEE
jgi:hypothetical protein